MVEKILERQRKDGSFRRVLCSDHCLCYPKHTGEVSFMMGYLLEGLIYAARLAGDKALLRQWRLELKAICGAEIPSRIGQGELIYGDGACGKTISQHLRMLVDVCEELL